MIERTFMSSRAARWFASESKPGSATTTGTFARRQGWYGSGPKSGASEPAPVWARAASTGWRPAATARASLGICRTASDRARFTRASVRTALVVCVR
jgi:hypothetical protein